MLLLQMNYILFNFEKSTVFYEKIKGFSIFLKKLVNHEFSVSKQISTKFSHIERFPKTNHSKEP